jgi:hypothetical protein
VVTVGVPGSRSEPVKLASKIIEGRVLELAEETPAVFLLAEGRIGCPCAGLERGQGTLLPAI